MGIILFFLNIIPCRPRVYFKLFDNIIPSRPDSVHLWGLVDAETAEGLGEHLTPTPGRIQKVDSSIGDFPRIGDPKIVGSLLSGPQKRVHLIFGNCHMS